MGASVKDISDELFDKWILLLVSKNDVYAHTTAIDIFVSHYVFQTQKPLPEELTLKLLTLKTLGTQATRQLSSQIEWDWSQVAKRYIEQYPTKVEKLIDFIAKYYGRKNSILESHHEAATVLSRLAEMEPVEVWNKVAAEIAKGSFDTYSLESWLRGEVSFGEAREGAAIQLLDQKMVIDWIEENPKERAPLVARMVPHDFGFGLKDGQQCWIRIILDKYGQDKSVRSALNSNLWSEGYSGPASAHYGKRLEEIKRFKKENIDSPNVQQWANEYIPGIEAYVDEAKLREERYGY